MPSEAEVAWAAGLWEGEGCWNAYRRPSGKVQAQCRLAMTDADVVERFAGIVGFGSIRRDVIRNANKDWKPLTEWYTQRRDKTHELIQMFWPYLGERRKAKAQELLDLGEAVPRGERPLCPKGHPYSGENLLTEPINRNGRTYIARRCKKCRREQERNRMRRRLAIPPERWRLQEET